MAEEEQGLRSPKSEWKGAPSSTEEMPIDRLEPNSNLHNETLQYLLNRLKHSEDEMQKFYARWQVQEEKVQAYISLPEWEKQLENLQNKNVDPHPTHVTVPFSYATISTIVTYLLHTFTGRKPIFQVASQKQESIERAKLMETVLQYQADHTRLIKHLHNWFTYMQMYGFGPMRCAWKEERRMTTVFKNQSKPGFMGLPGQSETIRAKEERTVYEGNEVETHDPFMFFPDPRVPMSEVNKRGEFVFWRTFEGFHMLKRMEAAGDLKWVDAASKKPPQKGDTSDSRRNRLAGGDMTGENDNRGENSFAQVDQGTVEIIPAELGLGDSEVPEKWQFTIVNKSQIVQAEPLNADHGMHPVAIAEPYALGQGFGQMGMADFLSPMQDQISWLLNSHQDNVRKSLNDMFVVDPSMVNTDDLKDPNPGKMIRLKRSAWGQGAAHAIQQLNVTDVTRQHIQDAELMMRLSQQLTAVSENVMGIQNQGGRKTATEVRTASEAAASRLAAQARIISAQGMVDLTEMMSVNTQQHLSEDFYLKIVGDEGKENPIHIAPEMVVGDFYYPVHDGTLPLDRVAMLDIWREIFQTTMQDEELRKNYSVPKIFEWIAELGGARNIEDFRLNPQPDQQVQQDRQNGNAVTPAEANEMAESVRQGGGAGTGKVRGSQVNGGAGKPRAGAGEESLDQAVSQAFGGGGG